MHELQFESTPDRCHYTVRRVPVPTIWNHTFFVCPSKIAVTLSERSSVVVDSLVRFVEIRKKGWSYCLHPFSFTLR